MYKSIRLIAGLLLSLSPYLYSTENDNNSPQKKCWPYEWQTKPYGNNSCNGCRAWTSGISGGYGGLIITIKSLIASGLWCLDGTCEDSCGYMWIGRRSWDPNYCHGREGVFCALCCIGTTALGGVGLLTSGCAWLPCVTENGCNKCIKKKSSSPLQHQSIEMN